MANTRDSIHNEQLDQDIDQFLFGSDEANTYSLTSNGKNRLEAKKKLARLIHQDVADSDVLPLQTKKKPVAITHSQVKKNTGLSNSGFVTDLRSGRRQLRKGWDQLEQPRKKTPLLSWPKKQPKSQKTPAFRKGGFEFSTVVSQLDLKQELAKPKPQVKVERPEFSQEPVKVSLFHASLAFAFVFFLLVIPVKTLWLAENVAKTKASILAQGKQAVANLQGGLSAINAEDYSDAKAKFLLASEDFSGIKEEIQGYNSAVISLVEVLPALGPKVAFANQVIEVGQNLSQAAAILSATANGDQTVTDSLDSLYERMGNVSTILTKADKTLSLIPVEQLPTEYQDKIVEIKQNLPTFIQQLTRARAVFKISNTLLGGKKLSRVLFVFQNNRELRATGGFAGSFAVVDFDRGAMTKFDLPGGGTYDVEAGLKSSIVPPYPLQLLGSTWNMWDANWWPDFPTSAKKMAWFYQKSGGTTVDAVIAVNSDVLQQLLSEIGPIDLPEYQLTVSSANVYDVVQQEVQVDYDKTLNQPKKILADLAPLIIEKVLTYPKKVAIGQLLIRAINNHDIQFYSTDSESVEELDTLGWSGKISDNGTGDYLQVVSTNLGGGKSDGYIERHVDHRADVQANGDIIVTTTLTKANKAPASDPLGYLNNVDYVRFYVPQGSVLLSAGGFKAPDSRLFNLPDPSFQIDQDLKAISGDSIIDDASGTRISQELGKTVFGHWMQVKPGETSSVYVTYRLPKKIRLSDSSGSLFINYWSPDYQDVDSYSLFIERQSGVGNMTFDASVVLDPSLTTVWHDALNPDLLQVNQRVIDYSGPLKAKDFFSVLVAHQ